MSIDKLGILNQYSKYGQYGQNVQGAQGGVNKAAGAGKAPFLGLTSSQQKPQGIDASQGGNSSIDKISSKELEKLLKSAETEKSIYEKLGVGAESAVQKPADSNGELIPNADNDKLRTLAFA